MSGTERPELPDEVLALDAASRLTRTKFAGGEMSWREWGEGEPLILLHGSHGGWMHWLRNIPVLARNRRVIAPDMPGYGESSPPIDLDSPREHATAIVEGLRALGLGEDLDVLAFSLGAMLACFVEIEAPELVRRLIVIDSGGLGTPIFAPDNRSVRGIHGQAIREVNRHNLAAGMIHDPSRVDETAIDINIFCGRRVATRVHWQVVPDKLLMVMRQVRAPIDAIWAEHDVMHPDPELNVAVIRQMQPDAELRIIADSGHWPMYEQPEAFNQAALELLSRPVRPRLLLTSRAEGIGP